MAADRIGRLRRCPKATPFTRRPPGCVRRWPATRSRASRRRGSAATRRRWARASRASRRAGKHLLVHFDGGLTLRTHLRMTGSWHVYRERRALAAPAVPGPRRGRRRQRLGGRVLPGAGGRDVPPGRAPSPTVAGRARARPLPARVARRRGARRRRRAGRPPRRPGRHPRRGAARPAHRGRASATSTSPRPASPAASTPPRRSRDVPESDRRRVWAMAARQLQANLGRRRAADPPRRARRLRPPGPAVPSVRHARS